MAYLVLEDGTAFEGKRIGAGGDSIGELVFTTGMVGYTETLTDPSYAGQIIMHTFPLIGNYGIAEEDFEGDCFAAGYVVRELCDTPSNFRSQYNVDAFLKKKGICGICGVDTRRITEIIREHGVMNAMICDEIPEDLETVRNYKVEGEVPRVTCKESYVCNAVGKREYKVVLIDYGAKRNIIRSLCARGCEVTVVPYDTAGERILEMNPDGVMLSNGPGDPEENTYSIAQIKKLIGKIPIFGICLGHQLCALAMGAKTEKLKFGHRGANQPARAVGTHRTYMTSQNHGYAVVAKSLSGIGRLTFENANDFSCEGAEYPGKKCFTVQFHPEACSGPRDTGFLFDKFISMMRGETDA